MSPSNEVEVAVRGALTVPCGRCKGRGKESWQVSSRLADGREDWPCIRCNGAMTTTDETAVARVLSALADLREVQR